MNESSVTDYITKTFPGVETSANFGYTFFFYGSDHRIPFATLASSDNDIAFRRYTRRNKKNESSA
jgi:hypothetical protein